MPLERRCALHTTLPTEHYASSQRTIHGAKLESMECVRHSRVAAPRGPGARSVQKRSPKGAGTLARACAHLIVRLMRLKRSVRGRSADLFYGFVWRSGCTTLVSNSKKSCLLSGVGKNSSQIGWKSSLSARHLKPSAAT